MENRKSRLPIKLAFKELALKGAKRNISHNGSISGTSTPLRKEKKLRMDRMDFEIEEI